MAKLLFEKKCYFDPFNNHIYAFILGRSLFVLIDDTDIKC